ncbi:alpha/beta fold hydrolase [Hyphobacterium sp.]|uniref:alpha/beta fold hydrolase n=1 Tax=Hyphobacterium sp. TaxID=2004662 RepID=UPI003BACD25E
MAFDEGIISSPTGAELTTYWQPADGETKGVLQINHGLAEHGARYERFATFLSQRGWATVVHDHRGHGKTIAADGASRLYAYEGGWNKLMADVDAVHDSLTRNAPGVRVVVFGHSMGGTIAMNYAMRQPQKIAGCAIWNANIDKGAAGLLGFVAGLGKTFSKPDAPARLIDTLTFKAWDKRFKADRPESAWLSRDLDEVDKYVADPLCGWTATWSLWKDFASGIAYAADDRNLKNIPKSLPFHLVGGTDDPATNNAKAVQKLGERLRRQGYGATQEILEGFRHETLNETGREAVMERFAAWLSKIADP